MEQDHSKKRKRASKVSHTAHPPREPSNGDAIDNAPQKDERLKMAQINLQALLSRMDTIGPPQKSHKTAGSQSKGILTTVRSKPDRRRKERPNNEHGRDLHHRDHRSPPHKKPSKGFKLEKQLDFNISNKQRPSTASNSAPEVHVALQMSSDNIAPQNRMPSKSNPQSSTRQLHEKISSKMGGARFRWINEQLVY